MAAAQDPHAGHVALPERERLKPEHTGLQTYFFIAAAVSGVLGLLGLWMSPKQFAFSYLFAFAFFWTLAVGSFFWTILHHAVDADWSVIIRRHFENVTACFPYLAVLFVPLLSFFLGTYLWPWQNLFPGGNSDALYHGHPIRDDFLLHEKQPYLGFAFTYLRLIAYFAFFSIAGWWLRALSVAQDHDGNPVFTIRIRRHVYWMIAAFGTAVTFSAIDWLMALDFHWYSTMWGVYIFAGAAQASMALAIIAAFVLKSLGYLKGLDGEHAHIMGKLLFAFTVFWAYIAFSQYMLIWYANLPEETVFFMKRNVGLWNAISVFLVAGHFVLPFFVLLFQYTKKSFTILVPVACWVLLMHAVDLYYIIMPTIDPTGWAWSLQTPVCFVFVGSVIGWAYLRSLASAGLFPARDPRILNCLKITN